MAHTLQIEVTKAYRQRKVPSGNKTDSDAWSLADALRVDGHGWKALAELHARNQLKHGSWVLKIQNA